MNFGKEILNFQVEITRVDEVKGSQGGATMVHFSGSSYCDMFCGKILPGGVDTQKELNGDLRTLSARYILEGIDYKGQECKIFVENNAIVGQDGQLEYTIPQILTDSKALAFLETADLRGTITPNPKGITIHIINV